MGHHRHRLGRRRPPGRAHDALAAGLCVALGVLGPARAAAAGDAKIAPAPAPAPAPLARIGTPLSWRPEPKGPPRLLWTGFRARPDGHAGDVIVQTSAPVEMELEANLGGAHLRLKQCRGTRRRTDRLALDTRFFASPVDRVSVSTRGHDVELQISLRTPGLPIASQEPGPGGSSFWILSFAAAPPQGGQATPAGPPGDETGPDLLGKRGLARPGPASDPT